MNRDPTVVGRARVSAETFAEIINSFIEPISYKTMVCITRALADDRYSVCWQSLDQYSCLILHLDYYANAIIPLGMLHINRHRLRRPFKCPI
jgi:hypothetical protein